MKAICSSGERAWPSNFSGHPSPIQPVPPMSRANSGSNSRLEKGLAAKAALRSPDQFTLQKAGVTEQAKPQSASSSPLPDEAEDAIAPSPQTSPYSEHRPALIALIAAMTPDGFEEFCAELLSRVGVEDVQTTRYSKDGGIDGTGRLRINEFVTMPIAFQSKKFDGSGRKVSSEEIQRFRGAMDGNIDKGIFF
ncbi:MAG: restriction endonuclease, partial [Xanthobacteraceae bacterium]